MSRGNNFGEEIKQRSGWLVPIAVFVVTAALSALILLYYLAPAPTYFIEEHPSPTLRRDPVHLSVGGLELTIPAHYLLYRSARRGGARREIELYTTFPDFNGYSERDAQTVSGNAADSPVIYILIREEPFIIGEAARLHRIYLDYVVDPAGRGGPFGLTQYAFREDSGYRGEDLFVGQTERGPVVMRCVRMSQNVTNPSCLRDVGLARGVALSYRFKRAYLANWRAIEEGVKGLVNGFGGHLK